MRRECVCGPCRGVARGRRKDSSGIRADDGISSKFSLVFFYRAANRPRASFPPPASHFRGFSRRSRRLAISLSIETRLTNRLRAFSAIGRQCRQQLMEFFAFGLLLLKFAVVYLRTDMILIFQRKSGSSRQKLVFSIRELIPSITEDC